MDEQKPRVFRGIMTAMLCGVIFFLVYFLIDLILGGAIIFLLKIPVIGNLLEWLITEDTPVILFAILAPILAYKLTMIVQDALNKEPKTKGLSCMILGISMILVHVLSIVINLIYKQSILANITQIIAGFVFFSAGKDCFAGKN